jgi:hypothetical protein
MSCSFQNMAPRVCCLCQTLLAYLVIHPSIQLFIYLFIYSPHSHAITQSLYLPFTYSLFHSSIPNYVGTRFPRYYLVPSSIPHLIYSSLKISIYRCIYFCTNSTCWKKCRYWPLKEFYYNNQLSVTFRLCCCL